MKIKTTLLTFMIIISFLSKTIGQERINFNEIPKNQIAATPNLRIIGENGYLIYYKRQIASNDNKLKYLRIGIDLYNTLNSIKEEEKDATSNKIYLGLEHIKKLDKFSLSYGLETSFSRALATNRSLQPSTNSILHREIVSVGFDESIEKGSYNMVTGIGFIGLKFFITKHVSIGYESAIGIAYFKSKDKLVSGETTDSNGILMDIDPSRYFTFEYSF